MTWSKSYQYQLNKKRQLSKDYYNFKHNYRPENLPLFYKSKDYFTIEFEGKLYLFNNTTKASKFIGKSVGWVRKHRNITEENEDMFTFDVETGQYYREI